LAQGSLASGAAPRKAAPSVATQALGLVPLVVGLVFGAVVLPRSVAPEEIPLPRIDGRALAAVVTSDDDRSAGAETRQLPSTVRAVGSALRAFNAAEGGREDATTLAHAHDEIIRTLRETTDADRDGLLDLRAFELTHFLAEVRRYERTGVISPELRELGGTFIERMTKVGWCDHHHLAMPEIVRRVAFKLTWNRVLSLDHDPGFALTLDETRALYEFYLTHPHASEEQRARFAAAMSAAPDPLARARAEEAEDKAITAWQLGKIAELGRVDPSYPTGLAQAAALFLKRDYAGSAMLYETWLDAHPSGEWTLRVKNHLQAALRANERAIQ
jgi:hypothetical protein